MLSLHNECLTRRYLLHRHNFLEGFLGFGLGIFRALKGFGKLGCLRLEVMLQGLELLAELLEIFLYLPHPSILFLTLGALCGRLGFDFGQRFLQGRHFNGGPCHTVTTLQR